MGVKLVWWFKVGLRARHCGHLKYRKFPSFSEMVGCVWAKETLIGPWRRRAGAAFRFPDWPKGLGCLRVALAFCVFPMSDLKWKEAVQYGF